MKESLFLASKMALWLLALLGAYFLMIVTTIKINPENYRISTIGAEVIERKAYNKLIELAEENLEKRQEMLEAFLKESKNVCVDGIKEIKYDNKKFSVNCFISK